MVIGPDKKPYRFNEYDDDLIIPNSSSQKKVDTQFNNEAIAKTRGTRGPNDLLNWGRDHYSTRKKVYRDMVAERDWLMKKSRRYHTKKIKPVKWYNW